jgi:arylformamidase
MRIYDVSVSLSSETPTYPGDPGIQIEEWKSLAKGDSANVSFIHFGAHSGTHVDAPAHFLTNAPGLESLSLTALIGPALLLELPPAISVIEDDFITANWRAGTTRVLFKTRNSAFWGQPEAGFRADYTYVSSSAAKKLVSLGVKLVGIDYLSVESFHSDRFETHHTLLSEGIVILEGLDFRAVSAGTYELICLPLRLGAGAGDGAPARAVLRTLNDN